MSYARQSDNCDVYVILSGQLECMSCGIEHARTGKWSYFADTTQKMIDHLNEHKNLGHKIPDDTFTDLQDDAKANDKYIELKRLDMMKIRHGR